MFSCDGLRLAVGDRHYLTKHKRFLSKTFVTPFKAEGVGMAIALISAITFFAPLDMLCKTYVFECIINEEVGGYFS